MKRNLFVILALVIFGCFFIIAAIFAIAVMYNNPNEHKSNNNQNKSEDTNEQKTETESADSIYTIANCSLYKIEPKASQKLEFANTTGIECLEKKVFRGRYAQVYPDYRNTSEYESVRNNIYVIDTQDLVLKEINFEEQNFKAATVDTSTQEVYSYIEGTGIYQGTFDNPKQNLIYSSKSTIYGRGGAPYDDFALRLSPNNDKLILVDTFSSINEDDTVFKTLKVIEVDGTVVFETYGTYGKWIDDEKIVYTKLTLGENEDTSTVVYDLTTQDEEKVDVPSTVYHIDVTSDLLLVDYYMGESMPEIDDLATAIFSIDNLNLVETVDGKLAYLNIIDSDTLIASTTKDCSGEYISESDTPYPCPIDGIFSYYEISLVWYDIKSEVQKEIVLFENPNFPNWY